MKRKKSGSIFWSFVFKSLILIIIYLIFFARNLRDYENVETEHAAMKDAVEAVGDVIEEAAGEVAEDEGTYGRRMYKQLNGEEQKIYKIIQQTLEIRDKTCTIEKVMGAYEQAKETLTKAIDAVYYDYPEYFWFNHACQLEYWDYGEYVKLELELGFYDYWELVLDKQAYVDAVNQKAQEIAELAWNFDTTYDKVKFVHDYLITYAEYDYTAYEERTQTVQRASSQQAHTVYGCLVNRMSVCDGYAKSFQMIMNLLGIECEYVEGVAGGPHAWNYIVLDGENYWMDVTWDNHDRRDEEGNPIYLNGVEYAYFCITSDTLYDTHTPDETFMIPQCDAIEYNFFYRENSYLETYSFEALTAGIEEQKDAQIISIKFGSGEAMEQAVNDLFTVNQRYWDLPYVGDREVLYGCDKERCILILFYP